MSRRNPADFDARIANPATPWLRWSGINPAKQAALTLIWESCCETPQKKVLRRGDFWWWIFCVLNSCFFFKIFLKSWPVWRFAKFWHDIWAVSDELNEQLMAIFPAKMTSQWGTAWVEHYPLMIYHSTASEGAYLISLKLCSLQVGDFEISGSFYPSAFHYNPSLNSTWHIFFTCFTICCFWPTNPTSQVVFSQNYLKKLDQSNLFL